MRVQNAILAMLIATIAVVPVFADTTVSVKPEKAGFSSERLDRITERMQSYVDSGEVVGALGVIYRNGEVVYSQTWGERDRENSLPLADDTIFRIYSMSKPITSVGLMMLYEEGLFRLTDPVAWYLPEFAEMEVAIDTEESKSSRAYNLVPGYEPPETIEYETEPALRPITIQDIFRHTAGFAYGFFGGSIVDQLYMREGILRDDATIADTVRKLGELPLKHQPGSRYEYSVAVDVQGRLIEVLSGQSLDEYFQERIFEPLGMIDTGFYVPSEDIGRLAALYTTQRDTPGLVLADEELSRRAEEATTLFSGGGGLVSTAADYLKFSQMLLNGGELDGVRLIGTKTLELMTVDHLNDIPNPYYERGYGFGLGFAVNEDLGKLAEPGSEGTFYWGGAAGTKFWVDPEENLVGVYMIQIMGGYGGRYGDEFRRLVYTSIID